MITNFDYLITMPKWVLNLEEDELKFIKQFVLFSGSLKDLAHYYKVSYPTVRLRLDKIIMKINTIESAETSTMEELIKYLAVEDKIDIETAKLLLNTYRKEK